MVLGQHEQCILNDGCGEVGGGSASLEEVCSDALVLTACSGAMSRDCTGVSSITTITGGNGRTCDLTRCGLNPPSGCHSGDGASGPTEGPGVVNLAQLLVSTSGALLTLDVC